MSKGNYTGNFRQENDKVYAERKVRTPKGTDDYVHVPITNFTVCWDKIVTVKHGEKEENFLSGTVRCNGQHCPILIQKEFWHDDFKLPREIGKCKLMASFRDSGWDVMRIFRDCTEKNSPLYNTDESDQIGWQGDEYVMPSLRITPVGTTPNDLKISSKGQTMLFQDIDMDMPDPFTVKRTLMHIVKDLLELNDHRVTYPSIAHSFLSPFTEYLLEKKVKRTVLYLYGTTGTGKSFLAIRMQSFFGHFERTLSWTSSAAFIFEELGLLKDVLVLLDNYKKTDKEHPQTLSKIIHSYTDNAGRGRMDKFAGNVQGAATGNLLITGERRPEIDLADISRCIIVDVESNKITDITRERGKRCEEMEEFYPMVMADFIQWNLQARNGWKKNKIVERIKAAYQQITGVENVSGGPRMRILNSLGINLVAFSVFVEYLYEKNVITQDKATEMRMEHLGIMQGMAKYMADLMESDSPHAMFEDAIKDAIYSQSVDILHGLPAQHIATINTGGKRPRPVLGYYDNGSLYLLRGMSVKILYEYCRRVKGDELRSDVDDIVKDLVRRGIAYQEIVIGGKKGAYIILKAEMIGMHPSKIAMNGDTLDISNIEMEVASIRGAATKYFGEESKDEAQ